ncbi:metalloregulator ArsR/SmtB family transcription factor [Mesorhizobium sp. VNQ89]|uniref:ArsR/SmtB family transcription factor n=1 Tax=Mesorhizobium quangtriensis TaxID=3157709 RepID=UPI0032B7A543
MATYQTDLPAIFGALSDQTRFAVVERLARGPAAVSELAEPFPMAGPSFLKHLKVLEQAGLIKSSKLGRVRTVQLAPESMRSVEDWIRAHRSTWEKRLDMLGQFLERDTQ